MPGRILLQLWPDHHMSITSRRQEQRQQTGAPAEKGKGGVEAALLAVV